VIGGSYLRWTSAAMSSWRDAMTSRGVRLRDWSVRKRSALARLRGIPESEGDLLIFVDDDNVLEADFLEAALVIAEEAKRPGGGGLRAGPRRALQGPAGRNVRHDFGLSTMFGKHHATGA